MKITSTNTAKPRTIIWNGKEEVTGIYKSPTTEAVFLGKDNVKNDEVSDRKYHGGEFKACYLFSENHYTHWKTLYPNLDWDWGMFGENLTIAGLNEKQLFIGDVYKIGTALIQITEPREPCYKLGLRFETQKVLKQFISHGFSGSYARVIETGYVKKGDCMTLVEKHKNSISIWQFFKMFYSKEKNKAHIKLIVDNDALPKHKRDKLREFLK